LACELQGTSISGHISTHTHTHTHTWHPGEKRPRLNFHLLLNTHTHTAVAAAALHTVSLPWEPSSLLGAAAAALPLWDPLASFVACAACCTMLRATSSASNFTRATHTKMRWMCMGALTCRCGPPLLHACPKLRHQNQIRMQ